MTFGLLGYPLSHSYSPQIHSLLGSYSYNLFSVKPEDLDHFFKNADFTGINVTSPYKKIVMQYCHELTDPAHAVGCVNTIVRRSDGKLIGHNSDYFGFSHMINTCGINLNGRKVLILGSGGAAGTVSKVMTELGADPIIVSRNGKNNYNNLFLHHDASIIVNATPVGMYPTTLTSLLDLDTFPNLETVLDLIYNPARTKLLMDAEERRLITANGLDMLVAQAKESAEWFTGNRISNCKIDQIRNHLENQMMNIVLIGMPGCGKTTIGKLLAQMLNREFVDLDEVIETERGISVAEFIESKGEDAFRRIETDVILRYGKLSSLVIATGGGCVTRKENYYPLHQNSRIYWIKRDPSLLPTEGRPLSKNVSLFDLYQQRAPLYENFADYIVENDLEPEHTTAAIISMEENK